MTAWKMFCVGAAVVLAGWAGSALAATPSGTVLGVIQSASAVGAEGSAVLNIQSPIYAGDRIETGPVGEAQIEFRDKTKLVVGPNSSMVVDAFVFNDSNTARAITLDATKGVFRFFTGISRKDAYQINTPTATIGVRGTQFDISIEGQGTTRVANFEGMTRICPRGSANRADCTESKDPCTLSVIRPTDRVVTYDNKDLEFRNRQLKYYFNYVRDQSSLRRDFQVDLTQCKLADVIVPLEQRVAPPGTIGTPPIITPPSPPGLPTPLTPSLPGSPTPPNNNTTFPVQGDTRPLIRP
ncbi:MAG: FecR domain-containing protein [Bauldia sp.]